MRLNNSRKAAVQAIDSIAYCEVPGSVGYPHTFHSRQFLESRFRMLECTLEYTLQFQLGFQNQTLLCLSHSWSLISCYSYDNYNMSDELQKENSIYKASYLTHRHVPSTMLSLITSHFVRAWRIFCKNHCKFLS